MSTFRWFLVKCCTAVGLKNSTKTTWTNNYSSPHGTSMWHTVPSFLNAHCKREGGLSKANYKWPNVPPHLRQNSSHSGYLRIIQKLTVTVSINWALLNWTAYASSLLGPNMKNSRFFKLQCILLMATASDKGKRCHSNILTDTKCSM